MATIILHDEDVFRLAASVNAKQAEGFAPAGGLLYSNGLYIQPMATGDAADPYVIVREQETQNFIAKAVGAALGSIQFVDGFFVQAFGSAAGGGGPTTVAWGDVTGKPATFAPTIGTTASTAKAGDYAPTWAQVTGKPAVIGAGADAAAARTAIGAGTPYTLPVAGAAIGGVKLAASPAATPAVTSAQVDTATVDLPTLAAEYNKLQSDFVGLRTVYSALLGNLRTAGSVAAS